MLRSFAVDRALMSDTEGARLAWCDPVPAHFDLQPAVATCGAASASPDFGLSHRRMSTPSLRSGTSSRVVPRGAVGVIGKPAAHGKRVRVHVPCITQLATIRA